MAIHSISTSSSASSSSSPSPSPTATSSPTLSSPSTTTTTPASHCSPSAKDIAHNGLFSLNNNNNTFNNSNHHSIFEDHDPALPRGINILNRHNSVSHHDGTSDPFGLSDYFSSSVPKANLASSNSIHIGSLSNGLSGLSLAAQGLSNTNNSNNSPTEEISTIFVVGFPEDMHEREFQNMFVFTPGFEAATLKIPQREQQEDDALTLGVNGVNPRKQIIGFAKFRSHQEAQQAIAVLSGRRVDAEKGSLLKAEMAKKNLHTRRGLSNELVATPGPGLTSTSSWAVSAPIGSTSIHPVNIAKKTPHPLQHRNSLAGSAAYDAFHSSFGGRHQQAISQQQQQQSSDISSSFLGRQNAFDMNRVDPLSMGSFSNNIGGLAGSISGSFSSSFSNRHGGLAGSQRLNKGFLDMDEAPTSTMAFLSKSIPAHTERGFNNALFSNTNNSSNGDDMNGNSRFQGMPISTAAPSMPSPAMASPGFRTPVNPGDQNPPCNTLYVGNLPMNTSEDELRTLFSRCVGYRRLCFRTKSNGPMCFVEFENVECATQALNDLYGNPLSNSVKGGIRLSFSKNPLGVRNSSVNQSSGLANQLHNMNGMSNGSASYLDRRDSMTAMFEQHY
ncbi:hypothetical protein BGZ91_009388 [Linnemannia elongata]|nr:hypothetical protein BGZ91_009388 [Linnemannia elongata]